MFDFELQFLRWLEGLRTDFLNMVFEGITLLGEETLIIFIVVALWLALDEKLQPLNDNIEIEAHNSLVNKKY